MFPGDSDWLNNPSNIVDSTQYDYNLEKNNTLYTYSFVIKKQYQCRGGYAKTLKRIYINWAKKRHYKYIKYLIH